ncbi:MAG: hypothetical protein ABSG42_06010 [Nitrospirota bacterium]
MKKQGIFMLSLLFILSTPLFSMAQDQGVQPAMSAGGQAASEQISPADSEESEMHAQEMDPPSCGEKKECGEECDCSCRHHGRGMEGMRERHMEDMRGEDMHGGFGGHMEWSKLQKICRMPFFYLAHARDLKLSDDQKMSLENISFDFKKEMITRGADVEVRELELERVMMKPDYKLEDATAKLKDIADARLALETAVLQYSAQARSVLSPDQLKTLKELCRPAYEGMRWSKEKEMKRHMMKEKEEEEKEEK